MPEALLLPVQSAAAPLRLSCTCANPRGGQLQPSAVVEAATLGVEAATLGVEAATLCAQVRQPRGGQLRPRAAHAIGLLALCA